MTKIMQMMAVSAMFMRMADGDGGYGYGEDVDVKVSPFVFGLNQKAKIKKFEWIPNGGKDGAEQEALDIIFVFPDGTEKGWRQFPVVKGFIKGGGETTDPQSQEFKQARSDFNAKMTHFMHMYVEDAVLKQGLAKKIDNFKDYCNTLKSLLPKNTPEIEIDVFMQYQFQLSGSAKRTYLDIPNTRKHGKFFSKHIEPVGQWKMVKAENPDDNMQDAIKFVDDANNIHPFTRNGWFANSNFAKQQKADGEDATDTGEQGAAMNSGAAETQAPESSVSTW